jgi:hypothetical protein
MKHLTQRSAHRALFAVAFKNINLQLCFAHTSTPVAATGSELTGVFHLFPSDRQHLSFWSGFSSPSIAQFLPAIF